MPIPGMRGMEHIGFTVPDINEACDFFEQSGAEVLYTAATNFRVDDSDWMLSICMSTRARSLLNSLSSLWQWNQPRGFPVRVTGPEQDAS